MVAGEGGGFRLAGECEIASGRPIIVTMRSWIPCLPAFAARILRRFVEENFEQISASLAYTTLLSLVPLVAMVFGVLSLLPGAREVILEFDHFFLRNLLPERSGGLIIQYVLEFSQKAAGITLAGLVGLFVAVMFLLLSIERALNHVWCVGGGRPWWKRLRLCVGVLAVWPFAVVCIGFLIYHAVMTSLGLVEDLPWLRNLFFKAGGLLGAAICFAGLFYAVPNARVAAADAFGAGVFTAACFFLMQKSFAFYVSLFPTFSFVYGAFAVVPIFLLWLYLSWAIVLLGALLAATLPEFRAKIGEYGSRD